MTTDHATANGDAPVFTLGIAMAGAISAGAYTAGVLDFLVRALEAHNAAVGTEGGPRHRIAIKAMSGASAGGICAALGALAFSESLTPRKVAPIPASGPAPEMPEYSVALRALHEIWVERVDLAAGSDPLLGTGDITPGAALRSLLNSDVLDRQADAVLAGLQPEGVTRSWLARDLDLFLTTTLLDGVPYLAPFSAEGGAADRVAGHPMANHAFARHFRIRGLGEAAIGSPWLEAWGDDGVGLEMPVIDLDAPHEPGGRGAMLWRGLRDAGTDWGQFRATALATGAFPGGLRSRRLRVRAGEFHVSPDDVAAGRRGYGGAMPIDMDWDARPRPAHPDFHDRDTPIEVFAVDGGVANNEPFELVRATLRPVNPKCDPSDPDDRARYLLPNPPGAMEADRAVLMIDPFPEGPGYAGAMPDEAAGLLLATLGKLAPALLNQARFKPRELMRASDEEVHSRYLISPSRSARGAGDLAGVPEGDRRRLALGAQGAAAIACGSLGGFGGFLDQSFRAHDFILGQRNCQSFLKRHFGVHEDNPVFADWKGGRPQQNGCRALVHLPEELDRDIPLPPWPLLTRRRFDAVAKRIDRRLDPVVESALRVQLGPILGWLAKGGYRLVISRKIKAALRKAIEADLVARDQIQPPRR